MGTESSYVLLLGGARSGKSTLAVSLAEESGLPTSFIATAVAFDDDMQDRIERHRLDRPSSWQTIEEPRDLQAAIERVPTDSAVIVDCVTTWVATLMHEGIDDDVILKTVDGVVSALSVRSGPTFVVSNEVGLGVHPTLELGRRYAQLLGWVNQRLAEHSGRALFLVAGRALPLLSPKDVLG
jgi:adenosyl cobinamide kinase/adenosyl cobinamide phosphate guanylyltransferase